MSNNLLQPSFAKGELSPALWARTDLAAYHVGAALLRNFFVNYSGGASNRAGFEFVARCLPGINRVIEFQFSTTQAYCLVFSDLKLRVVKDGGMVLETPLTITNITQANPGVLTFTGSTPSNGDWMYISGVSGMTQMNGRWLQVANVNAGLGTFQLQDLDGINISTTTYDAYASGGTVARVYTVTSPYAAADLALLKFTQSADTMTLTHTSYAPYHLTRSGHASWTFTQITFAPVNTAPALNAVTPSTSGSTSYQYVATSVATNGLTESRPSAPGQTQTSATMSLTSGATNKIGISASTGAQYYNFYRQQEVPSGTAASTSLYGFVGTSTAAGTSAFIDNNIAPDFTQTPPMANNPFTTQGNPGCVTYYDGRQIFAGSSSYPQTLWASKPGDFLNMDYSIPSRADDSIQATLNSAQVNAIQHLVPMQSMLAMTVGGAWKIDGGSPATPIDAVGNFSAKPQEYNGCNAQVPPIIVNNEILYVQAKGSIVRDLTYNLYANVYTGTDITALSSHLFLGWTILEWAYAEEPFKVVWAVRRDGVLLSLTFLKEQEVNAWTHSDTQGNFKSICTVSEPPEDKVYVVVQRTIPGVNRGLPVQYVERMHTRDMNLNRVPDVCLAFFVDCGSQYSLSYPAANATPTVASGVGQLLCDAAVFAGTETGNILRINGGVARITSVPTSSIATYETITDLQLDDFGNPITALLGLWSCTTPVQTVSGLWHLEGATVTALAGGNVVPDKVVTNGSITIDEPQDVISVGLSYVSQLQTLYLDAPGGPTIQGKRKKIGAVSVRVAYSRGLKVSGALIPFTQMKEIKERTTQPMGQPIPLITGDERVVVEPNRTVGGQVCLQQDYPLPASVLGIVNEVELGDK